jgi:hypothetical protein
MWAHRVEQLESDRFVRSRIVVRIAFVSMPGRLQRSGTSTSTMEGIDMDGKPTKAEVLDTLQVAKTRHR